MNIVETDLKFQTGRLRARETLRRIFIHHAGSAGDMSAKAVHRSHLNRGWAGIGYAYVIRRNGAIERGRPEGFIGAHVDGHNADSLGIMLAGNFEIEEPTEEQLRALVWLVGDIRRRHGANIPVMRHSDADATLCPGSRFPWNRFISMLTVVRPAAKPAPRPVPRPAPKPVVRPLLRRGSRGAAVRTLQQRLGGLVVDGIFGPRTEARVRAFQQRNGLVVDGIVGPRTWAALTG